MAAIIYHSKINPETGDFYFDKSDFETKRVFNIILLDKDPFQWVTTVLKDTNNRDKNFIQTFIKNTGLDFNKLSNIANWFPAYYTSFLMEVSNTISCLGFEEFKNNTKAELDKLQKGLGIILDKLPVITKDTKLGELSDMLNPLTNINNMLICYN